MTSKAGVRRLLVAVGLVVTVACTYFAIRGVDFDDARAALARSEPVWLLPAGAVFAVGLLLRAVRWWALFSADQRPPLREVTHAFFVGLFFNNILPARAGEAARVISLHRRTRTPRAETLSTVVIERVFDLLALLILLFAAYPWLPELSWLRAAALVGAVVLAAVLALVFALVRYEERAVRVLLSPLRGLPVAGVGQRLEHAVGNVTRGLVAIRDPRVALRGMALTIASWIVLAVSYWILMSSFSLDLPVASGILVTVAINLSLVLPSSPGALGVFEAATVLALAAFDVPQAEALSYALVLHLFNLVPFLVIGALLLGPAALRGRAREA